MLLQLMSCLFPQSFDPLCSVTVNMFSRHFTSKQTISDVVIFQQFFSPFAFGATGLYFREIG